MVILSEKSLLVNAWKCADVILCIVSSYIYVWIATFGEGSEQSNFHYVHLFFEVFFSFSILQRFLTDYTNEGESEPVHNLLKIVRRYFYSWSFVLDFIPIIPFHIIFHNIGRQAKLFFLLKILRMIKGLSFFNVTLLFNAIKKGLQNRLENRIANQPHIGEDTEVDHNHLDKLLVLGYLF